MVSKQKYYSKLAQQKTMHQNAVSKKSIGLNEDGKLRWLLTGVITGVYVLLIRIYKVKV